MPELGIVIVSHSADIAKGLVSLIREVAPDIPLTATGVWKMVAWDLVLTMSKWLWTVSPPTDSWPFTT